MDRLREMCADAADLAGLWHHGTFPLRFVFWACLAFFFLGFIVGRIA